MVSASNDSSLSSDQDTNRFLVCRNWIIDFLFNYQRLYQLKIKRIYEREKNIKDKVIENQQLICYIYTTP